MKAIDVMDDSYAEYNEDFNKKDPKFKVGNHIRISKYKNIFAKGYTRNWLEEVFVVNNASFETISKGSLELRFYWLLL